MKEKTKKMSRIILISKTKQKSKNSFFVLLKFEKHKKNTRDQIKK